MGGQKIMPPTDVSHADHSRAKNATVKAYVRPRIKKEDDTMIAHNRDRIQKARPSTASAAAVCASSCHDAEGRSDRRRAYADGCLRAPGAGAGERLDGADVLGRDGRNRVEGVAG